MFIVLEGVDGAGKSTLADRLVKRAAERGLSGEVWHRGVPVRHPLEEYEADIEADYDPSTLVVADRWHWSQAVYGGLYDDPNLLGPGGLWHVTAKLAAIGAVQIILTPPLELVAGRLAARGDNYLRLADLRTVYDRYAHLACDWSRTVYALGAVEVPTVALDTMIDVAEVRAERAAPLAAFPSYVGPRYPKLLLVGDEQPHPAAHRAALVPYEGTGARWLAETIMSTPLFRHALGLARPDEDLSRLVSTLNRPQVVALGLPASDALSEQGIEHGTVPSPRYMRYSYEGMTNQYANAVLKAAAEKTSVNPCRI